MATVPARNLVPSIRTSLNARLERLLERPIIARITGNDARVDVEPEDETPDVFMALQDAAHTVTASTAAGRRDRVWREDPHDGTCSVRISLDYEDLWRGCEKEILETVSGTVEGAVTFLTEAQKLLLERSPCEFLALEPRPESAELVSYEKENVGGSVRVVELKFAAAPESRTQIKYVTIVPNLVQIERQLDALRTIEIAADDGPHAALRALLGVCDTAGLPTEVSEVGAGDLESAADEQLDEYQIECIRKAITTPHFAVIQGPPGSGKTTVISGIIRRVLARGERVLVVSPTHVALDNVVEKLAPKRDGKHEDLLEERSLPVRYAARRKKLSERALEYWVGSKKQLRGATISSRVQRRLCKTVPFAEALYAMEDKDATGNAPLSVAVAGVEAVICGTPIGILSFETVKRAAPASFDLLIVDEVSKMTLPEFLAIAVKARRWVVVGDPEQLPPYNNAEENATTLDDVLDPALELVCSVGAILERARLATRRDERLVVVSSDPEKVAAAVRAHLVAVMPGTHPSVGALDGAERVGIVVCLPEDSEVACRSVSPVRSHDRTHNPESTGTVRILVERGLSLPRPEFASGNRLVEARARAQAQVFENSFNVYHSRQWSVRSDQKLQVVMFRNGLEKYLPSVAALTVLKAVGEANTPIEEHHRNVTESIAERFAINTVSVYDWLTGIPVAKHLDVSPLRELESFAPRALCDAVLPFVGTLRKQYRMHPSLSRVPRELFYFGDALHDGKADHKPGCRVNLVQVDGDNDAGESNRRETETICELLGRLNAHDAAQRVRPGIMIITPYRRQEDQLSQAIADLRTRNGISNLDVEVCTLDRCQGREAEYVLISLVRGRATAFLDMPKRWNVALTRAMQGLFIVGNIDAYLNEARAARRDPRAHASVMRADGRPGQGRLLMSLLARIIETYDSQIAESRRPAAQRAGR